LPKVIKSESESIIYDNQINKSRVIQDNLKNPNKICFYGIEKNKFMIIFLLVIFVINILIYPNGSDTIRDSKLRTLSQDCVSNYQLKFINKFIIETIKTDKHFSSIIKQFIKTYSCSDNKLRGLKYILNFNLTDNTENEEEIIKIRIYLEFLISGAPFLNPKIYPKNIIYGCYWDVLHGNINNITSQQFTEEECFDKFLKKFKNKLNITKNLIEQHGIQYSTLGAGIKNALIYMIFCGRFVGWEYRDLLIALQNKNITSAIQVLKNSDWASHYQEKVNYICYLMEKNINTIIPSYMFDYQKIINIENIKYSQL